MTKLLRFAAAIAVGLLVWVVVATLGNFVLRAAIPGYRAEEFAVSFSLIAQLGRLVLGVVSTAAAAAATVVVSRGSISASLALGCVLLALFVPVHVALWHKFPVWYHLSFLPRYPSGHMLLAHWWRPGAVRPNYRFDRTGGAGGFGQVALMRSVRRHPVHIGTAKRNSR